MIDTQQEANKLTALLVAWAQTEERGAVRAVLVSLCLELAAHQMEEDEASGIRGCVDLAKETRTIALRLRALASRGEGG